MQYAVVIESGSSSYGAHVPDLPGCVAVGDSESEVRALIQEAIVLHIAALKADGEPVPRPRTRVDYVAVRA